LWLEAGDLPIPITLPRIPGCEIAGEIIELGDDVDEWSLGDAVAVQSNLFCGDCEFCRRGEESLCLNGRLLGVECDGGFAEKVVVPWQVLAPIPRGVGFEDAAAVILAGSTAMHMLTDRGDIRSGDWVLVMAGASGVGSAAIQIARKLGARVISTGSTQEKRDLAMTLGAEFVVDTAQADWTAAIRKFTEKHGVDWVVEHIGGKILEQVFNCVACGGSVITCGATAGKDVLIHLWPFFAKQQRLIGSQGRNRTDLVATLEWVARGHLKPVIDRVMPLAEAAEALAALRSRHVKGKMVLTMG
jgi:NADPH:quinone reductase-like Zn-dependent oxidoreductase